MADLLAPTMRHPAHLWVPPRASSAGEDAVDLAATAGLALDAEQALALDALFSERADGRWAAQEAAWIEARQNGKSRGLQAAAIAHLFLFDARLIVWTAHLFSTTAEAFLDIKNLIENAPHLMRKVDTISTANGSEEIKLKNGSRLVFRARSKNGGRGISGDVVFLDEAFALSSADIGSLMPVVSARPNSQIIYASSAGMLASEYLRSLRDRGRAGGDPALAYVEWCAERRPCATEDCQHPYGTRGCALDDRDLWAQANHTLHRRISEETVAKERRAMPAREFARERLTWWEDPPLAAGQVIDPTLWARYFDPSTGALSPVAFGVHVTPDRTRSTIAVAGRRGDDRVQLEVVADARGTEWVPAWLAERQERWSPCAVVLDGTAAPLERDLTTAGVKALVLTSSRERAEATVAMFDSLLGDRIRHAGGPQLDAAAAAAIKRNVGPAWVWEGVGVGPLAAATLAHLGVLAHGAAPGPPPPPPMALPSAGAGSGQHDPLGVTFDGGMGINF